MTDLSQTEKPARRSLFSRMRDSDLYWSFSRSKSAKISALILAILILAAVFAPWIAPQKSL